MNIGEKDIREYEKIYKKLLDDKTKEIISKEAELITKIAKTAEYINIDTDIPNIGITFNNKLNELSKIFIKSGISMFAETNEEYKFVGPNFVGKAIIEDMISQVLKGTQSLSKYTTSIGKATKNRKEKVKTLKESGPIKKLFLEIRSFFVPTTVSDLTSYSEEERKEVNLHLSEYKEVDENLWKYNLRNNVVQSIVKFINDKQYDDFVIPGLLKESVIPTLQKLGLEDLIPQLQKELIKKQEQSISTNCKSWDLSSTQRLEVQKSQESVVREFKANTDVKTNNQDKEYGE